MKIYLAGPMRGLPDLNFPKFNEVAEKLRSAGHIVFNPAENKPREKSEGRFSRGCDSCLYRDTDLHSHPCSKCMELPLSDDLWTPIAELDDFSYWMAIDLPEVCRADAIVMLPGWEASKGARLELHTARECGKQVFIWSWLQTQEELLCESSR